jgi:hypothetical protein
MYIQVQVLTFTKAHEERAGPLMAVAESVKRYGHDDPVVAFSDDPIKVSHVYIFTFILMQVLVVCMGHAASLWNLSMFIQRPHSHGCGTWTQTSGASYNFKS